MRISAVHSTVYRYDSPVYQEPHTFRLRPRSDGSQTLLRYALEITPAPAGETACLDQDGNVIVEAWFREPMWELSVSSSFEVETLRENPFDYILAGSDLASLPLLYREPLLSALSPYLRTLENGQPIRDFARSLAEAARWETLPFLGALNQAIFEGFAHTIRDDGPPDQPETTLANRAGSCRDVAMLFCAACRVMGIPARFVSGYEREAAIQEQPYMHAWAEVYLRGGGWRGYDPSQGLAVSTAHVAVAAAADPQLAAPVAGTYRGTAKATMEFRIAMQL